MFGKIEASKEDSAESDFSKDIAALIMAISWDIDWFRYNRTRNSEAN